MFFHQIACDPRKAGSSLNERARLGYSISEAIGRRTGVSSARFLRGETPTRDRSHSSSS
jgi:hypothetical protein